MTDSMMMAHTKIPITVASCERTSEPTATPSAASRAAPTTAPAMCPTRVPAGEGDVVAVGGDEDEPDTGGDGPGDEPEQRPDTDRGDRLGGQYPRPSRGGQVGQGGGGVAELAVGHDGAEHGGQEHGEAGDGGHGPQPVGGGDGRYAGAAGPRLVVLQEGEQGGEGGSNGRAGRR